MSRGDEVVDTLAALHRYGPIVTADVINMRDNDVSLVYCGVVLYYGFMWFYVVLWCIEIQYNTI